MLVIGLDGATFDVLNPLMAQGRMPNLLRIVEGGVSGILQSTVPPITPAAWTTFLTGKQPGSHGIIDFERYEPATNRLHLNSTHRLSRTRNLWQILSDQGLKVGSVNVPMTYPPTPVNGVVVTGFDTPGVDSDFVFPAEIKQEILDRWPDPTIRKNWRRRWFGGDRLFEKNVDYMARSFHQAAEMTQWLGDRFGWDVLMVVFKLIDNLQHKTWKYIDPRWSSRNPRRRDIAIQCFTEADLALGKLLDYAETQKASVMLVSDHGHGSLEGKVYPNAMLQRWGYLELGKSPQPRASTNAQPAGSTPVAGKAISEILPIDVSRSKAFVAHAGMAGFLYINLQGRQPHGVVKPSDYESLRDELMERFLGEGCRATNPQGQCVQLFDEVHRPEELYGCSRADQPWLPDLILIPRRALAVVRKIRGRRQIQWLSYRRLEGTHRPEGIFLARGDGIKQRETVPAHIADCAPTILTMLGLPVPSDMDGRVLVEIFEQAPTIKTMAASAIRQPETSANDGDFSEADIQRVTQRLADLGYLE